MQRSRHVDALVVAIGAFEPDIARGGVGADAFQEAAQRRAAPFADHAPALDADMARHLALPAAAREAASTVHGRLLSIRPGQLQAIIGGIKARRLLGAVPCVVAEILHRHRFGKGRRQPRAD